MKIKVKRETRIIIIMLLFGSIIWARPYFPQLAQSSYTVPEDTQKTRYSVKPTSPVEQKDLKEKMLDLHDPNDIQTTVTYDDLSNTYVVGTKLGDSYLNTPFIMSPKEYHAWSLRRSMSNYYVKKNAEAYNNKGKDKFDFTNMQFDLGPAEKIFGPGGVQLKSQGSAELKLGVNMTNIDNPSLPIRNRKTLGMDFDEKVNLSMNGKIGDKMDFNLNYNTESTFDFDAKNLKLQYQGKEDEIVKLIEAGNISFPTNNSLIQGSNSLFGVRTDLQFGKLKLQTVVSQKKSVSKTVSSNGGTQLTSFEISADNYEANRHFFLSHFFRDNYDRFMSTLPNISSGITINRIEIWITNKNNTTTNTRNIVGFTDLGENSHIGNSLWSGNGIAQPSNNSNNLYSTITSTLPAARQINEVYSSLSTLPNFTGGMDYEKIESARLLNSSEYTLNTKLGYISLHTTLQTDQVLAVAYEYTYRGQTYQVGEFSTDRSNNTECLFVKTLKNATNTPQMANWNLMMKNVYSLGASSIEQSNFRLDVKYLSDTSGVYLNYLPEKMYKNTTLLKMLNLDRLDNKQQAHPNGYFDFIQGYTIDASEGRIFFPAVEPFGKFLANAIGDKSISDKYIFQELYDSTKTVAKQIIEKDKFELTGQYKGTSGNVISLGAMNVPRGSVVVTAGGVTLTENSDYSVNYGTGEVTILNQSILDAGTPISVSLESTGESLERKTMLGVNWEYDFNKNFLIGGTLMHLGEQSLTSKVTMGNEPLNNTIFGLNISWKQKSQWLTDMLDKLPFIHCSLPSTINFSAEFAKLYIGKNSQSQSNSSYLDDFENTKSAIDISNPTDWVISSCPQLFSESKYSNDVRYGYNRALLSWYNIDPLFTRRSSSLTPSHIKSDLEQLSNHYVREVYRTELFPNKELTVGESSTLNILNLAYYPSERGPYNLNTDVKTDGTLYNPDKHWGGMMRSLETTDFETANIEYIEFWMLDPFIYDREKVGNYGGDFYIDLGDISEDILKDGNKFYESGMPTEGNTTQYIENNWGRIPTESTVTYAFNTSSGSRAKQDVGLNGLSSTEEATYPTYLNYLNQIRSKVKTSVYDSIAKDPAGDDYHYFRGTDYDNEKMPILQRYKRINNPEGNSVDSENSPEKYSTAYKTVPDVEDVNKDYTLNEYNNYYEYRIHLNPDSMNVGSGYIVDKRTTKVTLRNGEQPTINWYLYRIPLTEYLKKEGNINDFSSIRFMRMFMTNFQEPIVMRFGTLELVRGEWRNYQYALTGRANQVASGSLDASAVNIQENNTKTPVNYVLPPGISPVIDRTQSQLTENNEQALNITVKNLPSGDARAVYKNYNIDLRQYKHIQMFTHANALTEDASLKDNETSVFIRMGSDYKNNYYEYEIPLTLTAAGHYDRYTTADCKLVWPENNMLDINLSLLTDLKKERNRLKSLGQASYTTAFSDYDPNKPNNKITVMGNPSLGEIRTLMIGVRNNSRSIKSVEVWVNELRLQDYSENGGYAARGALDIKLSDLATVALSGHMETAGFGGLEQGINERRNDNLYEYGLTTNIQLGKLFPEKAKVTAPFYYSFNKRKILPKYDPLDTDMTLEEALDALATKREKDSLENICTTTTINRNLSISNVRVNIATKNHPMPYDPANFAFSYSHSHKYTSGETTIWETNDIWKLNSSYDYSPVYESFAPLKNIKDKSGWLKILKEFKFNWLPQNLSLNSDINRTYYELQERDIQNLEDSSIPLTFSSDFLWNRSMTLNWDITNDIHTTFQAGTNAEIEEPYEPVNKNLYPDEYSVWKDSVWHSIKNFGRPLSYAQSFNFSWKLPLNMIPIFKWINTDFNFDSSYGWERGTTLEDNTTLGNTITNSRNLRFTSRFDMEELYNMIPFLKSTNRYYTIHNQNASYNNKKEERKIFEKEIQIKTDSNVILIHNLRSRNLRVKAITKEGKRFPLKYKIATNNAIKILNKDSCMVKVTITPIKSNTDRSFFKTLRFLTRTAMMVRNINISYNNKYNMYLPGFMPNIGDFFGQREEGCLQPGLDFAFGLTGDSYINKAKNNGWLLENDSASTPATSNRNYDLQITALLEPFPGFKVDLTASRSVNRAHSMFYMYDGMPSTQSGSFNMTTISIKSAFEGAGNANNSYKSKAFNRFVSYLSSFRDRVESQYTGATYPSQSTLTGKTFDPANGTVTKYSSDVMIPAFLAAYCGGGKSSPLNIFPSITRMFPNWHLTYGGLMNLPWIKKNFKSFTLEHAYKSIFSIGSYNTYSTYMQYMGDLGFVTDATSGNPIPSSMYDISTVSINEAFSPILGINTTLNNDLTLSLRYNQTRVLTLSMTSQQLTEALSKDFVIGIGYKINDIKLFKTTTKKKQITRKTPSDNHSSKKTQNEDQKEQISSPSNETGMNNTLNIRFDFSIRNQSAINRDILTQLSQATSGNNAIKISFSAEYTLSKLLTLSFYFDRQTTKPLLSSNSYPTTTQDFGLSMKFSLTR